MNDKGKPQTTPNRTTPEHQTEKPNKDQRRTTGNSRAHQPVQEVSRAHHTVQTRGCEDWTCMRPTISWTCMEPTTSPLKLRTEHQPYAPSQDSAEGVHRIPDDVGRAPAAPLERRRGCGGRWRRGWSNTQQNYSDKPPPSTRAVSEINLFRGSRGACMLIGTLRVLRRHAPHT